MTTPSPLVEKRQLRKFNTLGDPLFSRAGSLFKRERSSRALSPASPSPSPAPLASPLPQAEVRNPLLVIESLQAQLQVAEASVLRTRDDVARERDFSAKELEQARGDAKRSLWVGTAVCLCMLVLEAAAPDFAELRVGVAAITLAGLVAMSTRYALHSKPQRNTCVCGKWAEEEQQRCADCGLLSTGFKDKYALMGMLGRGSYSTVRVGVDKQANKDVAVKVVAKPGADSERLVVEVRALQALRHPRVIRFIDWYEDGKTFYIVTELAAGGELFGRIVERVRWSERDARQVVMTLAETMLFMHERGYVHRDIKPENILLRNKNDDSSLLLADFGFVAKVKKRGLTDACGTPLYVAPEIVSGVPYGTPVDCWSLGIILFILLGGSHPFAQRKQVDTFRAMRKGELVFDPLFWTRMSNEAKDCVSALLRPDPAQRLTVPGLLAHPWLAMTALNPLEGSVNFRALGLFNARRKLKGSILAAIASNQMHAIALKVRQEVQGRR